MNNAGLRLVVPGADSIQTWNLCALHPRAIKECQILGDSASVTVSQCHSVTLHNWRKYCDTAHFKIQLAHNSQPHHMCTDNTLLSDKNWPPFCGFITIHHKGKPPEKNLGKFGTIDLNLWNHPPTPQLHRLGTFTVNLLDIFGKNRCQIWHKNSDL